jgi:hypothetical protein
MLRNSLGALVKKLQEWPACTPMLLLCGKCTAWPALTDGARGTLLQCGSKSGLPARKCCCRVAAAASQPLP